MAKPINLYVQMDVDLGDHRKVIRMAKWLDKDVRRMSAGCHTDCPHVSISEEEVIGYLYRMWSWTLRYEPEDGRLDVLDEEEIARIAHYPGDPNHFVKGLMEVGFLTSDQQVYRWKEVYGPLSDRRKSDRDRKRKSRGRHADVTRMSSVEESREKKSRGEDTDPVI